jgi:hypothetical protein
MHTNRMRFLILGLCALVALAAYGGESAESDLKPVAVAVFKNGLAFVVREGSVRVAAGEAKIPFVPMATLGSLWVAPDDPGATLEELVAYRYSEPATVPAATIAQVLKANPGKIVTVSYGNKEYTGEIVGLKAGEKTRPEPVPEDSAGSNELAPASPEFLLLKSEGKMAALPVAGLGAVELPPDTNLQVEAAEWKTGLKMKLKGAGDRARLTMAYLEKGIGWTPSYLVTLKDDKTAEMTLQSVVTNDAEDINDADMFFVVGVPNFAYSNIPSPMALNQTLEGLTQMEQAGLANRTDRFSNALQGQSAGNAGTAFGQGAGVGPGLEGETDFSNGVSELAGAPEEDLFLYSHNGTTLQKGERATYNVFTAPVEIEHIYQWDIADTSKVDAYGNVQNNTPNMSDQDSFNRVWHSLRMKNGTKFPWTSAPALVISGTKPLAQDTLPYTPKGASSNLKITIATDIRATQQELEVARDSNIPIRRNYRYDLVTVEGTLKLENYKSKDVHMVIHKSLRGEVISSTDDGKAEKLARGIVLDNPWSTITWDFTLKAGEKKAITYRYKVYVRE